MAELLVKCPADREDTVHTAVRAVVSGDSTMTPFTFDDGSVGHQWALWDHDVPAATKALDDLDDPAVEYAVPK